MIYIENKKMQRKYETFIHEFGRQDSIVFLRAYNIELLDFEESIKDSMLVREENILNDKSTVFLNYS